VSERTKNDLAEDDLAEDDPAKDGARLRLAGFAADSRVNGPGRRVVLWVQGCDLACPGCFNPSTHAAEGERELVDAVLDRVLRAATPSHAGMTFSGGEPFQQATPLAVLARDLRRAWPAATLMAFTGYRRAELTTPAQRRLLACLDYLVDGRYVATRPGRLAWRTSSNQTLWPLGDAPPAPGAREAAADRAEIQVDSAGGVLLSGSPDPRLIEWVRGLALPAR